MSQHSQIYTVGWICALAIERDASWCFLDKVHDPPPQLEDDINSYTFGEINGHNIVIAMLPMGEYGTAVASRIATNMLRSFHDIRIALLVGVGGGAPYWERDIRLGDVVVSTMVVQHDYGKQIPGKGFEVTNHLDKPPESLRLAIQTLRDRYADAEDGNGIDSKISAVLASKPRRVQVHSRPDSKDVLYTADTFHPDPYSSCEEVCVQGQVTVREPRVEGRQDVCTVHYGLISSGNTVIKDATMRDLQAKHDNVLCFEMEAAGLMNTAFKCLVIRGICDYCDSHKNKKWQGYAAMAAAAYARDLLRVIQPSKVEAERKMDMELLQSSTHSATENQARPEYAGPCQIQFSPQSIPRSSNFVSRPADTAELERCLLPRTRSQPQQQVFVLYGLGGIGKTQLAVDFVRRHRASFSSVFWLDGRSEDRLRQSLAGYAKRIPKGQIPEKSRNMAPTSEDDLNVVVADVLAWLARLDNVDWLMVIDNVDQDHEHGGATGAYDVRKYLPGDHGAVLITTRLLWLAQLGSSKQLRKVDKTLGKAIFEQWRKAELVMDMAGNELLSLLDGLPVALAQAASYLHKTKLDPTSYVRLYREQWDELMKAEESSPLMDYEQRSVATTWIISFKAVEATNKSAANLVRVWAFLDNKDLWRGLLQATADGGQWPAWLREMASNEVRFMDAIRLLLRYSMVEGQGSLRGSYMMHPVVHRWTAHVQNGDEQREFLQLATMMVGLMVPSSTTKDYWVLQQRLLPHAERCSWWIEHIHNANNGEESFVDIPAVEAIHNLGALYSDQGRLDEAEAMYDRALQGKEKALEPDHTSTLDTVNNLGLLYKAQGRLDEAEAMYDRALQGKEKALGPDHTSTLDTVNNLGLLYKAQGRLDEAEAMYDRALQGKEKALGPDHTSTLDTVNNLGLLYKAQGRLDEAEAMYDRALQGYEKSLGSNHTATLSTVNNLGLLYRVQGRLDEAEAMYERALRGQRETLGPDHTVTLTTINNLSALYRDQGRLKEAEALYGREGEAGMWGFPEYGLITDAACTVQTVDNTTGSEVPLGDDTSTMGELAKLPPELLEPESTFDAASTLQTSAVDTASTIQASTFETDLTSQSSLHGSTGDGQRKPPSQEMSETGSNMSELAKVLSQADKDIIIRLICGSIRKAIPDIGAIVGTARSHPDVQGELVTKFRAFIKSMKGKVSETPDRDGLKVLNLMQSDIARRCRDELLRPGLETRWPTNLGDLEPMDQSAKVAKYLSQRVEPEKWTEYEAPHDESPPSHSEPGDGLDGSEDGELGDDVVNGINAREVIGRLTADPAFEVLISEIRDVVEQYAIDKLAVIRIRISESFASKPSHGPPGIRAYCARFKVDWDLVSYLRANYNDGDSQKLSSIVATIGVLPEAQLCTLGEYFKQVQAWKSHETELLKTLQEALRERKLNGHEQNTAAPIATELPTVEGISVDLASKTIVVSGSEEFIVVIAQQLALVSALTHDNCDLVETKYAYIRMKERPESPAAPPHFGPLFDVSVHLERPPQEDEDSSCWTAILGHSVLITGYPTKDRQHRARGLEASPQTMAALAGIPVAVTFGGGFVFKGPYHALVPIEEFDGSVQWHVITSSSDQKELEWQDILKHCHTRLRHSMDRDKDALWEARSFFGWCRSVVCDLGSSKVRDTYDSRTFDPSGLKKLTGFASLQINKITGTIGISKEGKGDIAVEMAFARHKGVQREQRSNDYENTLRRAKNIPVILHGTKDRRAIQTDGEEAVLHLLLHRRQVWQESPNRSKLGLREWLEAASPGPADPVRTAMELNGERVYRTATPNDKPGKEPIFFKKEVSILLHILESFQAYLYEESDDKQYPLTLKRPPGSGVLYGWEYEEVVEDKETRFYSRKEELDASCGDWPHYARGIKAVPLFIGHLGAVIQPERPEQLCVGFRELPASKSYLAVRSAALWRLFREQGDLGEQLCLTDDGHTLFGWRQLHGQCGHGAGQRAACCCGGRVQMVVKGQDLRHWREKAAKKAETAGLFRHVEPKRLAADGKACVLLGRDKDVLEMWKSSKVWNRFWGTQAKIAAGLGKEDWTADEDSGGDEEGAGGEVLPVVVAELAAEEPPRGVREGQNGVPGTVLPV